jgi:outer membrane receptor for ferrienterochelin and colicins
MSIPFARTALSCAMIGCSWTALAQNAPVTLNDTVVSAAGFEQKITEAPASISVISREDLQQKRYNNLAQALGDVEGIDIGQGTGKTGGLNISIRGMPSQYTLILIDGRRQNAAGNVTPNGFNETSTSFMPPLSAIERIEVIRGPMSTLYGSDAMGGVINIITRKVAKDAGLHLPGRPRLRRYPQHQHLRQWPAGRWLAGPAAARKPVRSRSVRPELRQRHRSEQARPLSGRGPHA